MTVVFRGHAGLHPAPYREIADNGHAAWMDGVHQIVEDLIRYVLVEDAAIPEFDEIVLQRLELDALGSGHVGDANLTEIGQAGLRTHRREFRTADRDSILPLGPGIREGLDGRARHGAKILAPACAVQRRPSRVNGRGDPPGAARASPVRPAENQRFRYVPCLTVGRRARYDTRVFRSKTAIVAARGQS